MSAPITPDADACRQEVTQAVGGTVRAGLLGEREERVERGEVEPELLLHEQVEERDHLSGAGGDEEAGKQEPGETTTVADDCPEWPKPEPVLIRGEIAAVGEVAWDGDQIAGVPSA